MPVLRSRRNAAQTARRSEIQKIRIDTDPAQRDAMMARTNRRTVPQIFIGDTHVGGYDDLAALDRAGGLMPLLNA